MLTLFKKQLVVMFPKAASRDYCRLRCVQRKFNVTANSMMVPSIEWQFWPSDATLHIGTLVEARCYALLCVSFPRSDLKLRAGQEDALYEAQFGQYQK